MKKFLVGIALAGVIFYGCKENVTPPDNPGDGESDTINMDFLYAIGYPPNLAECFAGYPNEVSTGMAALNEINGIRALHGLPPVEYDANLDTYVQKAALIIAANNLLSHDPPSSSKCWTSDGKEGSSKSNLLFNSFLQNPRKTESLIDEWFKDSNVAYVGHRRWLLDPFLKRIAFARVDATPNNSSSFGSTGAAVWVIDNEKADPSNLDIEFIAYPQGQYPSKLFNSQLDCSFSVLADKENWANNQLVNLSKAQVLITTETGIPIDIFGPTKDNSLYGLGNCLTWSMSASKGTRYNVQVSGIQINGDTKTYQYWFELQ